jgi:hypothetical protein
MVARIERGGSAKLAPPTCPSLPFAVGWLSVRVLVALAGIVLASSASAACLVSFNDAPRPPCDGGACTDTTSRDAGVDRRTDGAADSASDGNGKPDAAEAGSCKGVADGTYCGPGDPCHDAPTCFGGACMPHERADGTPCGIPLDACHSIPTCTAGACGTSTPLVDGTQWKPGDDNARCCGGQAVETTSDTNCGVCQIKCNTAKGQSCNPVNGHYFCTPCTVSDCWSGCCSLTTTAHCSPSNCSTGSCQSPDICPDGAHCQSDVVNYCSY